MNRSRKMTRPAVSLLLAVLIIACSFVLPNTALTAHAAESELTSIGLAEHGLRAYREGWEYAYATYGNKNENGVRTTDCSGLIYSYLCWDKKSGTVVPNYSYPRTVYQQMNASSVSGTMDTLPRTHGLLVTVADGSHIGIYVGNNMVTDNSTWDVDMRHESVRKNGWYRWHKLDCITYPTNGWYKFDGDYYYYEDGEYVVDTTRKINGTTYTFGSDGIPDKNPDGTSNDGFDKPVSKMNAKVTAGVRLRSGPGLNYETLTVLAEGTSVNVTSTKNPEWYAVTTGSGEKGYVYSEYVKITGTVPETGGDENNDSSDSPSVSGQAAKTTTAVHLRSGRGTNYKSLGVIAGGTAITVTDKSNSSWYGVTVNGKSGYMFSEYIKLSGGSNDNASSGESNTKLAATTTADVHLRSGRGTNYTSKGVISSGTSITVTDTSNSDWYGVTVNGKSGYMFSEYIKLKKNDSSSGSASKPSSSNAKTTADVHLRSGKGTNYSSKGIISSGTSITVTDTSSKWYGVTVNGKSGYMYSEYISMKGGSSSGSTMKTTAYLNLRSGAGTNHSVILVIPEGASVKVLDRSNSGWYKVSYNGKTGFVSSDYLR